MLRIGFHSSISGGVHNAPMEAAGMGCNAFQIFTTSSRSWKNSTVKPEDGKLFVRYCKEKDLEPFAHIPYLCNPSSPNAEVYGKSRTMLADNIMNCDALGIGCLVIHLGSHLGRGVDFGIGNICDMLGGVLDMDGKAEILLENGSGYKNCVGSKFQDIGSIIDMLGSKRVGVCLDTCHAFAAGYDIGNRKLIDSIADEFHSSIGHARLGLVHLNDAKYGLGSGLDRHWHIGKGMIGEAGFASFFSSKVFCVRPYIMELPDDNYGTHSGDLAAARRVIGMACGEPI
ncbi:MAG: deoxyribonuclease IV [Candidatus Micrarchaeaceae archaeon]